MVTKDTSWKDLEELSHYVSTLDIREIDPSVVEVAKACVLYGLAVGIATIKVPIAQTICQAIDMSSAPNEQSQNLRLLDGKSVSLGDAAMANGVLLSGRAQGDSHPAGHMGGITIPSALAIAQQQNLSGLDFLSSLIAGYEVGLRIARDHASDLTNRGFRTSPCYGVFAAAAVGARGLNLNSSVTMSAIALAANLASGLREYVNAGTDESPLQAGFAARSGLTSALLAANGIEAAPSSLHGPAGFFTAYGSESSDHGKRLVDELGSWFEFTHVTYKPYPACQFIRGTIRGIAELRQESNGANPISIEVKMHPFEADFIGIRYAGPFSSASQTLMSVPFCAALTWLTGTTGFMGLRDLTNESVLNLASLVDVVGDDALRRYQTQLTVKLDDGRVLKLDEQDDESSYFLTWDRGVKAIHPLLEEVGASADLESELIQAVADIPNAPNIQTVLSAARNVIESCRNH